jgi:hypothetical protein
MFAATILLRHRASATPRDGIQPRPKAGSVFQLRQRFESHQKHFLSYIFGGVVAAQYCLGYGHDRFAEAAHQFIERNQVAQQRRQNKLFLIDLG